jgi:hypothetical protein
VVVFLIGVSLLPRAFAAVGRTMRRTTSGAGRLRSATLAVMIAVALSGGRAARYARACSAPRWAAWPPSCSASG